MLLDEFSHIAWRPNMPEQKRLTKHDNDKPENMPLAFFACPSFRKPMLYVLSNASATALAVKSRVSSRIDHWPAYSRYSLAIDRVCIRVFESMSRAKSRGQMPAADSDGLAMNRRSFAVPRGYLAGIWGNKALPSQKRYRQIQASSPQTPFGFAGRRCKEASRRQRQFAEGFEQGVVLQKQRDHKAY